MAAATNEKIDLLNHIEAYLAKRDGLVNLLDIAMYASNFLLATSTFPKNTAAHDRLECFSSSLSVSIKALQLGKFIQEVNRLRGLYSNGRQNTLGHRREILLVMSHGGAGLDLFMKQFVWLALTGLIDHSRVQSFSRIRYWAQFIGSVGAIALSSWDLWKVHEEAEEAREIQICNEEQRKEGEKKAAELHQKVSALEISIALSFLGAMEALADIRGKGFFGRPLTRASRGLLSHALKVHQYWISTR